MKQDIKHKNMMTTVCKFDIEKNAFWQTTSKLYNRMQYCFHDTFVLSSKNSIVHYEEHKQYY